MKERIITRKIGEGAYTITPLASKAGGLDIYRKLHGYVFPLLGSLAVLLDLEGGKAEKLAASKDAKDGLSKLVERLGGVMADDGFNRLVDRMMVAVAYNSAALPETHWDEHLSDYDEVVACCVWVNFIAPFLASLTRLPGAGGKLGGMSRFLQTWSQSTPGS